jgi:site-specific recombinase XerD
LEKGDADLVRGLLTIRETKFRKTRIVPLHATAVEALRAYVAARDRIVTTCSCERFFVHDPGYCLAYSTVRTVFRKLCNTLSIKGPVRRPRLHDLRHTFACRRVEQWHDTGVDVTHAIAALSVYLGHAKVTDTYWYLTATPRSDGTSSNAFRGVRSTSREGGAAMTSPRRTPNFATLVQEFFCDRLINQQIVSQHTVAAYRDSFRLLLGFVGRQRQKSPATLSIDDIDAPTVWHSLTIWKRGEPTRFGPATPGLLQFERSSTTPRHATRQLCPWPNESSRFRKNTSIGRCSGI